MTRVTPYSWKVIQVMSWFCGYWADRYLWRELLDCRLLQGYEEFLHWCGTSARLVAVTLVPSLLEAERKKERSRKRGDNLVDLGPSSEGVSELPALEETPPVADLRDESGASSPGGQVACLESREAELLPKHGVALSKVTQLRGELEVSRAKGVPTILKGESVVEVFVLLCSVDPLVVSTGAPKARRALVLRLKQESPRLAQGSPKAAGSPVLRLEQGSPRSAGSDGSTAVG
ncbi:hypothetical protein ACLOJK_040550 [Asimina triloba]